MNVFKENNLKSSLEQFVKKNLLLFHLELLFVSDGIVISHSIVILHPVFMTLRGPIALSTTP